MTGDTLSNDVQLLDEEIYGVLTYETSPTYAAAVAADAIAGRYARQANTQNGALRVSAERRMDHYSKLAKNLRAGGPGDLPGDPDLTNATMSVQGTSVAAKDAILSDSDNVQNVFSMGMDDYPGSASAATL